MTASSMDVEGIDEAAVDAEPRDRSIRVEMFCQQVWILPKSQRQESSGWRQSETSGPLQGMQARSLEVKHVKTSPISLALLTSFLILSTAIAIATMQQGMLSNHRYALLCKDAKPKDSQPAWSSAPITSPNLPKCSAAFPTSCYP